VTFSRTVPEPSTSRCRRGSATYATVRRGSGHWTDRLTWRGPASTTEIVMHPPWAVVVTVSSRRPTPSTLGAHQEVTWAAYELGLLAAAGVLATHRQHRRPRVRVATYPRSCCRVFRVTATSPNSCGVGFQRNRIGIGIATRAHVAKARGSRGSRPSPRSARGRRGTAAVAPAHGVRARLSRSCLPGAVRLSRTPTEQSR